MNLFLVLGAFVWFRVVDVPGPFKSATGRLLAAFQPFENKYVCLARAASAFISLGSLGVFISAVYHDKELDLEERIGLSCATLFESLGSAYSASTRPRGLGDFASLVSTVALVFASGIVSSFERTLNDRSMWIWYPAFHVAVFHCAARIYLIKNKFSRD